MIGSDLLNKFLYIARKVMTGISTDFIVARNDLRQSKVIETQLPDAAALPDDRELQQVDDDFHHLLSRGSIPAFCVSQEWIGTRRPPCWSS